LTTRFSNRGFSVVALSGELTQNERTHALQSMRDGRARVCVATDVAARGIDLPNLELVIHAELPSNAETMLHRSGRTGRAGRKGVSVLIVPPKSRRKAESLLRAGKVASDWSDAPSAEAVIKRDEERLLSDPIWTQENTPAEVESANKLTALYSSEQIATAFLRLFNSRQSAPEELAPSGGAGAPLPRAEFGPSVWFSISGGHKTNAEPRRLLPMLCKAGNITKDDIGAIRVQATESFVEIRKASLSNFLKSIGNNMMVEGESTLIQLDKPPSVANSPRPSFAAKQRDRKPRAEGQSDRQPQNSKPTDWNDDATPRKKKPKPTGSGDSRYKPQRSEHTIPEGVTPYKARTKPDGAKGKPAGKPGIKSPTPAGKPSSKKNRARTAAAAEAKQEQGGKPRAKHGKR
jgi:ATP-dependent RNA helicase DeaD